MLIFALLLSLITSAFEDFLWQIRHGSIPVVEGAQPLGPLCPTENERRSQEYIENT